MKKILLITLIIMNSIAIYFAIKLNTYVELTAHLSNGTIEYSSPSIFSWILFLTLCFNLFLVCANLMEEVILGPNKRKIN